MEQCGGNVPGASEEPTGLVWALKRIVSIIGFTVISQDYISVVAVTNSASQY